MKIITSTCELHQTIKKTNYLRMKFAKFIVVIFILVGPFGFEVFPQSENKLISIPSETVRNKIRGGMLGNC
jgi:hypothetical protein